MFVCLSCLVLSYCFSGAIANRPRRLSLFPLMLMCSISSSRPLTQTDGDINLYTMASQGRIVGVAITCRIHPVYIGPSSLPCISHAAVARGRPILRLGLPASRTFRVVGVRRTARRGSPLPFVFGTSHVMEGTLGEAKPHAQFGTGRSLLGGVGEWSRMFPPPFSLPVWCTQYRNFL